MKYLLDSGIVRGGVGLTSEKIVLIKSLSLSELLKLFQRFEMIISFLKKPVLKFWLMDNLFGGNPINPTSSAMSSTTTVNEYAFKDTYISSNVFPDYNKIANLFASFIAVSDHYAVILRSPSECRRSRISVDFDFPIISVKLAS